MRGRNQDEAHPAAHPIVSILARSDERAQPYTVRPLRGATSVSILARSSERAQPGMLDALDEARLFQSSPAHLSGRNLSGQVCKECNSSFQSSPAHLSGRNFSGRPVAANIKMFQSSPAHLSGRNPRRKFGIGALIEISILARSSERAQPLLTSALTQWDASFQSSPAHLSGRNPITALVDEVEHINFNPRPLR